MHVPRFVFAAVVLLLATAGLALGGSLQTARAFTVDCDVTPTLLKSPLLDGYNSIWCDNNSTTSVFLGGPGVSTTNSLCISKDAASCPRRDVSWDVSLSAQPSCIVAGPGTVTLKCLSGK